MAISDRRKNIMGGVVLAILAVVVAVALVLGTRESEASARDKVSLCLLHRSPPVATLAMLDVTDPLAAGSGERFTNLLVAVREDLARHGRLTIIPFGGDLGQSLTPSFDGCSPGRGAEAQVLTEGPGKIEREYQNGFVTKLNKAADQLKSAEPSKTSPIAEQVERAVSDPAIGWSGTTRKLLILTDGLQNTAASRIYAGEPITLPPPPPGLLAGVTVDYIELANPTHPELQTPALRAAWKAWFTAAGAAKVNMYAPGYPRPAA